MASPTSPTPTTDTGKAKVVRAGQTAQSRYGTDPQMQGLGKQTPRDLTINVKKA